MIGRFPGETSCLTLAWAVMGLVIAGARGLALSGPDRGAIAALVDRSLHPERRASGLIYRSRGACAVRHFQQIPDATGQGAPFSHGVGGRATGASQSLWFDRGGYCTTIPLWLPLIELWALSVAVMDWVPLVLRVTTKTWTPLSEEMKA